MSKILARLFILLLLISSSISAFSIYEDKNSLITKNEIFKYTDKFYTPKEGAYSYSDSSFWLKFDFSKDIVSEKYILFNFAVLTHVDMFYKSDGDIKEMNCGAGMKKELPFNEVVLIVPLKKIESKIIYVRVKHKGVLSLENKIFDSNSTSEAGIQAWKTKKNIIALNSVINSSYIGILVYGDYNKVFANVTESNATAGVRIVGGNGNRVEHNIILDSFPYWSGGTNTIVKNNIGYTTESSGTQTFDGDGTTTKFTIAHGLVSTPSNVQVTPRSADAAGDFYVTVDDTNIYVNYSSAPPSGSDNVVLGWEAEV